MKLLAIDTGSQACSVALWNEDVLHARYEIAPRKHNELLIPMVESVLRDAKVSTSALDVLAFGRGPGSFTGVRIAASFMQGLALATGLPVVPVSSLQALAQGAYRLFNYKQLVAAFDARLGEVYWGSYLLDADELMQLHSPEAVEKPELMQHNLSGSWVGAGQGWGVYSEALSQRFAGVVEQQYPDLYPDAQDVATIAMAQYKKGLAVPAHEALPVYLRDKVVS